MTNYESTKNFTLMRNELCLWKDFVNLLARAFGMGRAAKHGSLLTTSRQLSISGNSGTKRIADEGVAPEANDRDKPSQNQLEFTRNLSPAHDLIKKSLPRHDFLKKGSDKFIAAADLSQPVPYELFHTGGMSLAHKTTAGHSHQKAQSHPRDFGVGLPPLSTKLVDCRADQDISRLSSMFSSGDTGAEESSVLAVHRQDLFDATPYDVFDATPYDVLHPTSSKRTAGEKMKAEDTASVRIHANDFGVGLPPLAVPMAQQCRQPARTVSRCI